jgi:hypothetical protein
LWQRFYRYPGLDPLLAPDATASIWARRTGTVSTSAAAELLQQMPCLDIAAERAAMDKLLGQAAARKDAVRLRLMTTPALGRY